jgi:U3 small nucleolar RNA-associated protein 10
VECLGAVPKLDTDIVQRVLGFVFDSLNPEITGDQDYKAGALMIVGVLATRASLAPKLVQNLIFFVARTAQHDAFESVDLPWLRVTVMAIISLVQSQSVHDFPKKALMILKDIRDFSGVLSVLSSEYNIERFVRLYVESLVDYSTSDDSCHTHLIETIETLPMENSVERIVSKVLGSCSKVSRTTENPDIKGIWAKKILSTIERKYPLELHDAIRKFLEKSEINSTGGDSLSEVFGLVFDESKKIPTEIADSNIWFSLDHPKAMVRQSALSKIATSGIFNNSALNPQKLINMQDAILRSMYDDDLSVVQAALSIEGLAAAVACPDSLLKAYDDVLTKCIKIINKGGSKASKASDVAVSCLEKMVIEYQSHHVEHAKDIAAVVFRLLIIHPKTLRVNLKALELAKKIQWEFYTSSSLVCDEVTVQKMKENMSADSIASINMKNIKAFAETFLANPNKHVEWLANSGNGTRFSRTLFLLVVLETLVVPSEALDKQVSLCKACLPALKDEWHHIQHEDNGVFDEISIDKLEKCSLELVKHIFNSDTVALNARILSCIFWGLLKVQSSYIKKNFMIGSDENAMLDDLFLFFVTSPGKNVFQKHLEYLIINCTGAPFQFISKYFLDEDSSDRVQVESLHMLASICSKCASSESSSLDESIWMQLLLGFPSVILPLAHENRDIRSSAIKCVEGFSLVWQRLSTSVPRNGNTIKLPQCMSSPTFGVFLESLVNQKTMISSDAKFFPAYISSMLSPRQDMIIPENLHERFDQPTKDALLHFILHSALKLTPYGKFMVLSILKGVGGILFKAEDVKSLFFDLLDCRDQYQNQRDSKQSLSTHEIQILCLLLEVLFSLPDRANIGFNMYEPLVRALKVDALSPDDPVVVMPCLTVLRTLQPVFFDNLETDTKEKVFGCLISLFRTENIEIRNATRDALLRINVDASTAVKFIELIVALGDARGRSKRTKRKDDLSRDAFSSFEELFGESPIASILVSLLDILFLKKDVNQRSGITELLFFVSTLCCVCLTFHPRAGCVYYNRFSRFYQSSFLINGFQRLFVSIPTNMIPHPKPLIYPTP